MSDSSPTEHLLDDTAALAEALAERLAAIIRDAVAVRGQAVLALAGGRTPMQAYRHLAALDLPWHAVTLVPTDERWVSAGHPARNDDEIAESFALAGGVRIQSLVPGEANHAPVAATTATSLASLPMFDAVLLGMGADAHTASLFPGADGLAAAMDPDGSASACVIVPDPLPPEAPYPRISLTAGRLLRTRQLLLAITGEAKRTAWQSARTEPDPLRAPISLFARQHRVPFDLYWSP
jgi:6-phosphogluconolactonase